MWLRFGEKFKILDETWQDSASNKFKNNYILLQML